MNGSLTSKLTQVKLTSDFSSLGHLTHFDEVKIIWQKFETLKRVQSPILIRFALCTTYDQQQYREQIVNLLSCFPLTAVICYNMEKSHSEQLDFRSNRYP